MSRECRRGLMSSLSVSATCCQTCRRIWTQIATSLYRWSQHTRQRGRLVPRLCKRSLKPVNPCRTNRKMKFSREPPGERERRARRGLAAKRGDRSCHCFIALDHAEEVPLGVLAVDQPADA